MYLIVFDTRVEYTPSPLPLPSRPSPDPPSHRGLVSRLDVKTDLLGDLLPRKQG
jgi:hypothetical protein